MYNRTTTNGSGQYPQNQLNASSNIVFDFYEQSLYQALCF
jgi:hypothetical protein